MKRFLILCLSLFLLAGLVGCKDIAFSRSSPSPAQSPSALTTRYQRAITAIQSESENESASLITSSDDANASTIFRLLGVTADDMTAYALRIPPSSDRAYGIALIKPAAGHEGIVEEGLKKYRHDLSDSFMDRQVDQYEIARSAKIERLDDDTMLFVMCREPDNVAAAIKRSLSA